jgi:hypothetical protein
MNAYGMRKEVLKVISKGGQYSLAAIATEIVGENNHGGSTEVVEAINNLECEGVIERVYIDKLSHFQLKEEAPKLELTIHEIRMLKSALTEKVRILLSEEKDELEREYSQLFLKVDDYFTDRMTVVRENRIKKQENE